MKAIPILAAGAHNTLKITEWPDPKIKEDEVLIDVKAFGLNFADIMARKGQYPDAPPMPFIAGYEVAGIVKEIGSQVDNVKVGDKVLSMVHFGGYAELVVANRFMVFPLPETMTYAEGASIPVNFITAYHCLHNTGSLMPGAKVLIQAAAGGVGLAAVQLAKLAGCEIFGTAGSEEKLKLIREWGVDHAINYTTHDFEAEINKITNKGGIDVALESVGGSNLKKCINLLRPHGRVAAFGISALSDRGGFNTLLLIPEFLSMVTVNIVDLLKNSKGLYGVNMLSVSTAQPELVSRDMKHILSLFAEGKLKTIISKEYSWDKIGQAHHELESRKSTGKMILTI